MIYFKKNGLPDALLNRLTRLASFQNPEFYKAQALRLSTFGKPRIISCGEEFSKYLGLPRGCLKEVIEVLESCDIQVNISDKRVGGLFLNAHFNGTLTSQQQLAAEKILAEDVGVLSATTAFGKTVVAAWLIARRKTNTLILVHRRQLMDQWHERLKAFLDLPSESLGLLGGGKNQLSGQVDIATFQSVNRKGGVLDLVADYGQVIVDECHHVSAVRFEQVLRQVKAKYVCGLTATPTRKDGHHPIIYMQCGPVRFQVDSKKQAAVRPFEHIVIPRYTRFVVPPSMEAPSIQEIYATLAEDEDRNELIINDLLEALERGCSPVLLAERTSHVEYFESRLRNFASNVVVLRGGMGKRQRQAVAERLAAIPDTEERVLIATGRYIGEGFDDSRLDTLFLVSPVSWKGTLQQYAGRLHRLHHNKRRALIYDYVDYQVPQLERMFNKRLAGYRAMGYQVQESRRL
jgi:superfamily II DNA or RNA helicase